MNTPLHCNDVPSGRAVAVAPRLGGMATSSWPWSPSFRRHAHPRLWACHPASRFRASKWVAVIASLLAVTGCGYSQGELLYMLGFGRGRMVKAQFRLSDNPVLILIDDQSERVNWPAAKRYLTDELAQELIRNKAAKKIIPPQTPDRLRQTLPEFDRVGCRELGKLAGAEQVLWIQIQEFFADEEFVDAIEAAHFMVTIKVINVLEEQSRSRVRLWPASSAGAFVTAVMSGSDVARLKTKDAVSKELAARLADRIAKLFYDHRLGDFERDR